MNMYTFTVYLFVFANQRENYPVNFAERGLDPVHEYRDFEGDRRQRWIIAQK